MAATPPSLTTPPPPPPDHTHQSFLSPHDYPDIFSFMPPAMPTGTHNTSDGFGVDGAIPEPPPPPPPAAATDTNGSTEHPPLANAGQNGNSQQQSGEHEHEHSTSDEDDDSEDEEGERAEMDRSWYSIFEEKREFIEDELRHWEKDETVEHSAVDHAYWEKKAFTDLKDPELRPSSSGRIDFVIDRFNGTRDKPNKETVMRSEVMSIGGYDWRLKFYPKGNNTDHLSVYIENVTMQAPEWEATEEFESPPLPFLSSCKERPRKRRCVAAQVCVVLYNPTEPRKYENRQDAHQFTKDSPDYGWTRFTRDRRRDLGVRRHFERGPLLQDDKLAFKAYIRVINDPTGCLWDHNSSRYRSVIAATGLRPFSPVLPILAADLVLLHFPPFQDLVYKWQQEKAPSKFVTWMNTMLWKMLSRERSEMYGDSIDCEQSDAVAWIQRAAKHLGQEEGPEKTAELLGSLNPTKHAAVGGNRLKTRSRTSVQAALDAHDSALETPALLTLELERQHFDREKREWKRITNKVDMENEISVKDKKYKLFAFVTHCGELASNTFKTYVRPHGPQTMWYGYSNDRVTCMTHKQALGNRCGQDEAEDSDSERSVFSFTRDRYSLRDEYMEIAHVAFYVREDYADAAFKQPTEVEWKPPKYVTNEPAEEEAAGTQNDAPVTEEKEVPQDAATKRASISSHGSAYDAGCATPTHWFMDEDGDVVMSESEDEIADGPTGNEAVAKAAVKEAELVHRTVDNLGCSYYSGEMLGSRYHGKGHLITLNGDEYVGTFARGLKSGTGKMIYATNGDIYEGEWAQGERHGSGKYIEASTGNVFDGMWKNDRKSGKFTLTGTVTEEDKGFCSICYEKEINTAFYDCGHAVTCYGCAQQIEDCPVCRRRIVSRLQLYGVKISLN